MYDGPFCVLCAVDGPRQHRLLYEVLDHDPDHDDRRMDQLVSHARKLVAKRKAKLKVDAAREGMAIKLGGK